MLSKTEKMLGDIVFWVSRILAVVLAIMAIISFAGTLIRDGGIPERAYFGYLYVLILIPLLVVLGSWFRAFLSGSQNLDLDE